MIIGELEIGIIVAVFLVISNILSAMIGYFYGQIKMYRLYGTIIAGILKQITDILKMSETAFKKMSEYTKDNVIPF